MLHHASPAEITYGVGKSTEIAILDREHGFRRLPDNSFEALRTVWQGRATLSAAEQQAILGTINSDA
jgi:hypothetical protein